LGQGREKVRGYLKENPAILEELAAKVKNVGQTAPVEVAKEEDADDEGEGWAANGSEKE
jgi:hypothetical protein